MASDEVRSIVNRLIAAPNFREQFNQDRAAVLDQFNLTPEDRAGLEQLNVDSLVDVANTFQNLASESPSIIEV